MQTRYDNDGAYLSALADVFGDPTRRAIYRRLRKLEVPVSASEMAEPFGLHRTVARAHLEKLVDLGLVEFGVRRRSGGGRPAKVYKLATDRLEVIVPARRFERLSRLLLELVGDTVEPDEAAEVALRIGRRFGHKTAVELGEDANGGRASLSPAEAVAWMDAAGYDVELADAKPDVVAIEVHNCVYSEVAREHPELVCGFDRGMMCGLLGVEQSRYRLAKTLVCGDECCRHEFRR